MKKTNLAEAMQRAEKPRATRQARQAQAATTREGKKNIAAFVHIEVSKQLKMLGLEVDKTQQDLLTEAINDLFTKYKKPPIA